MTADTEAEGKAPLVAVIISSLGPGIGSVSLGVIYEYDKESKIAYKKGTVINMYNIILHAVI